jgi:hypothetical protein
LLVLFFNSLNDNLKRGRIKLAVISKHFRLLNELVARRFVLPAVITELGLSLILINLEQKKYNLFRASFRSCIVSGQSSWS